MSEYPVREYIVRETCYPLTGGKQEVVGELTRCRDCKWFDMFEPSGNISPITFQCKRVRSLWMEANAYCKYGERKEDE